MMKNKKMKQKWKGRRREWGRGESRGGRRRRKRKEVKKEEER
jgi:hypothetical protein